MVESALQPNTSESSHDMLLQVRGITFSILHSGCEVFLWTTDMKGAGGLGWGNTLRSCNSAQRLQLAGCILLTLINRPGDVRGKTCLSVDGPCEDMVLSVNDVPSSLEQLP